MCLKISSFKKQQKAKSLEKVYIYLIRSSKTAPWSQSTDYGNANKESLIKSYSRKGAKKPMDKKIITQAAIKPVLKISSCKKFIRL